MQNTHISRTTLQRKTSHFEKYRKELDRISQEIKNKNHSSTSFSEKSDSAKESKTFNTEIKIAKTHYVPTIHATIKKSNIFEVPKEPRKQSLQSKQDAQLIQRQSEATREVQLLVEQLQRVKLKIQEAEGQIVQKRSMVQSLKKEIEVASNEDHNEEIISYAEKILAIEARMKFKKELHEDQLHRIVNQKNVKHSENVELSKFIQQLQQELNTLSQEYDKSEKQEPITNLKEQASKAESELTQITNECAQIERKINDSQQLKGISLNEYKRYSEVYKRQMLGRQIAQTEDRIKQRNNQKRYLVDIQRKKYVIKEKKVENTVRQKSVIEVEKVIKHYAKQIEDLKRELLVLEGKAKSALE